MDELHPSPRPAQVSEVGEGGAASLLRSTWRRAAPALLVFLVTFIFQLPLFDRWFTFMDEGHMLLFADIVANGGQLYRDATLYPLPGAFYLLALVFKALGPSILVSRWIVMLQYSVFVALGFVLLRKLVPVRWAVLGVFGMGIYRIWVFPHWHIYSYSTTALLIFLVALLGVLRFFRTARPSTLALAGFTFGLGVFCKQDYGAAMLLAVIAGLLAYVRSGLTGLGFWRLCGIFLLPAAGVGALAGLYFYWQGVLPDVIRFAVLNPFVGMATYEYTSYPPLLPLFVQDPALRSVVGTLTYMPAAMFTFDNQAVEQSWLLRHTAFYDTLVKLFFYLPYPVLLGGLYGLWKRRGLEGEAGERQRWLCEVLLFSFAASFILLVSLNKPQDYLHLAVLYAPLIWLGIVYLRRLAQSRPRLFWWAFLLAYVPLVTLTVYSGRLYWLLHSRNSTAVEGERAGVYVQPTEARFLNEIVAYIEENSAPDETVAVMPYFPIVQFLADRRGPHRSSYILWPFPEIPDRDQEVVTALEETDTKLIIYNHTVWESFPPIEEYATQIFNYLVEHFETERMFTFHAWGYKAAGLKRRSEPVRGTPLVRADGADVAVRIESLAKPPYALPPAERSAYLELKNWPFRPALALRPSLDGARTVASFPLSVPSGGRLRTAIGIRPSEWFSVPPYWVRFSIEILSGGERERVFARTLEPVDNYADRGWFDIDLSLERYEGSQIRVELATETNLEKAATLGTGGWEQPRLLIEEAGGVR